MSKKAKTALVVVGLLVGIGVFNYLIKMDPTHLAERGVGSDPHSHGEEHEEDAGPSFEDMLSPLGPEDAPVQITVLWTDPADLERVFRPMLSHIATSYNDHIRAEFLEPNSDEYNRIVEEVAGGVGTGLVINGEMIKKVPEADLGMLAFTGSPTLGEWGEREVRLAVEHELEEAGIEYEPQVEHDHAEGSASPPAADEHAGHSH